MSFRRIRPFSNGNTSTPSHSTRCPARFVAVATLSELLKDGEIDAKVVQQAINVLNATNGGFLHQLKLTDGTGIPVITTRVTRVVRARAAWPQRDPSAARRRYAAGRTLECRAGCANPR